MMYYQCLLVRDINVSNGVECRKEWIEARGAKLGARVELLPEKEDWIVNTVYTPGIEVEALREKQKNNRDALPSLRVVK